MANQLLPYHHKIHLRIVLIAVRKSKNLYQLEPMFVTTAAMWKIEILMRPRTSYKKRVELFARWHSTRWGTPELTRRRDLPSGLVGSGLSSDGESANQESPCMRDRGVSMDIRSQAVAAFYSKSATLFP